MNKNISHTRKELHDNIVWELVVVDASVEKIIGHKYSLLVKSPRNKERVGYKDGLLVFKSKKQRKSWM